MNKYFWIITLQARTQQGLSEVLTSNTIDGIIDITRGMTREQAFRQILAEATRAWRTTADVRGPIAVLYFSMEPQALRTAGSELTLA